LPTFGFHYFKTKKQKMKRMSPGSLTIGLLTSFLMMGFQPVLQAQDPFWNTAQAYLGQNPPGDKPEIFGQGILKDSGIVLGRVTFSKDGKAFYYSFAAHWFDDSGSGTKEIKFDGQKWQKPKVIAEKITNPAFSPDYKRIYLGGSNGRVWVLDKTRTGWSKPTLWLEKPYGLYNFQAANSGIFYTGSNGTQGSKKDWSTYDFCKLTIAGKDTVITSLGNAINTPGFDGDFFIAPDESYIIISAKETKDFESELWISFRKKDKTWTIPQSLGDKINNGLAHRFGQYVTPDGKYLFYTQGTNEADCTIYWVRFDQLLSRLKPEDLR
jgi:hypothetical protein